VPHFAKNHAYLLWGQGPVPHNQMKMLKAKGEELDVYIYIM
jgi:hypothetical protein